MATKFEASFGDRTAAVEVARNLLRKLVQKKRFNDVDMEFEKFMMKEDPELLVDHSIGLFTKEEAINRFLDKHDYERQ